MSPDNSKENSPSPSTPRKKEKSSGLISRLGGAWTYFNAGVWNDNRRRWWIRPVRTLNLSMKSFLNSDIQTQACAMTFRTLLAIVPALALIFAIGRGFGLQNLLQNELFGLFPGQKEAISQGLGFVDKYLEQSSEGIFVGVGLVFLLYTVINLVSNVEDTFNLIWGVKEGRSLWRKISDYTAMLLILPVLLICAGGLSMLLSSGLQRVLDITDLSFLAEIFIESGSWVMTCLFFTAVYILVPNTKVSFKYALFAGTLAGTGFMVLQWIFVSGQMYVARYNAIYGSFSFVPLLLIWMQLVWMVCLVGAVICYSSQNVYSYSFVPDPAMIAPSFRRKIVLALTSVVTVRFRDGGAPVTMNELVRDYGLPPKTVSETADRLIKAGIIAVAVVDEKKDLFGYVPAKSLDTLTISYVFTSIDNTGNSDFIPDFNVRFPRINALVDKMEADFERAYGKERVVDIEFITPIKSTNIK